MDTHESAAFTLNIVERFRQDFVGTSAEVVATDLPDRVERALVRANAMYEHFGNDMIDHVNNLLFAKIQVYHGNNRGLLAQHAVLASLREHGKDTPAIYEYLNTAMNEKYRDLRDIEDHTAELERLMRLKIH